MTILQWDGHPVVQFCLMHVVCECITPEASLAVATAVKTLSSKMTPLKPKLRSRPDGSYPKHPAMIVSEASNHVLQGITYGLVATIFTYNLHSMWRNISGWPNWLPLLSKLWSRLEWIVCTNSDWLNLARTIGLIDGGKAVSTTLYMAELITSVAVVIIGDFWWGLTSWHKYCQAVQHESLGDVTTTAVIFLTCSVLTPLVNAPIHHLPLRMEWKVPWYLSTIINTASDAIIPRCGPITPLSEPPQALPLNWGQHRLGDLQPFPPWMLPKLGIPDLLPGCSTCSFGGDHDVGPVCQLHKESF